MTPLPAQGATNVHSFVQFQISTFIMNPNSNSILKDLIDYYRKYSNKE